MKKLLALLLAMILCLGVLVACNSEAEKERLRAEIESEIRAEIEAEERAKREKTYTFYRLEVECNPDIFKTNGLYCEYDGFYNFFRDFYEAGNTEINNITRNTFQDYYVLCVRVGKLLYRGKNASYNNLRLEISDSSTSIYSIDYCADYYPGMYFIVENDLYSKTGFHLVLIPKEEVPAPNIPDIFVHKVLTITTE